MESKPFIATSLILARGLSLGRPSATCYPGSAPSRYASRPFGGYQAQGCGR